MQTIPPSSPTGSPVRTALADREKSADIAAKLREARALIERGWVQGDAQVGDNYCALGACDAVVGPIRERDCDYFDLRNLLQRATGLQSIVAWNDAPERTKAEVLAAFDKAIALAESAK